MMPLAAIVATLLMALGTASAQTPATASPADSHLGSAVRLMLHRQYAEAAAEFEKVLALKPDDDKVRIQYATCLFAEENNDAARRQFEIVRKRAGSSPGIEYYLGLLDYRADHYTAAIEKLSPLEALPAFPKASFYLGLAYLGAGQTGPAIDSLERAARNIPQDPDVHYRLGRVYSMAGRVDDAEREYTAYRSARESQRVVEEEGPACMDALRAKPIEEARQICGRIAGSGDAPRLLLLGQLYAQAGAYPDAIDPLARASKLQPDSFEAWHYLGMSLYASHRYAEAVEPLRNAVRLNPQYFDTLNLLAKTLYTLKDYAGALPVLERAHDLNPGDAQLASVLERLRNQLKDTPAR